MTNNQKILASFILIIIVAIAGYFLVSKRSEFSTSNWETYRNERYGIEFKYPNTWKMVESDPTPNGWQFDAIRFYEKSRLEVNAEELEAVAHNPDFQIYLINGRSMTLDQNSVDSNFGSYVLTDKKTSIGGKDWTIIKCNGGLCEQIGDMAVYLPELSTVGVSISRKDVLSTFKFTK